MKILIIGSLGFVGKHLVKYFSSKNYEVYGCGRTQSSSPDNHYFNVEERESKWKQIFTDYKFDYCINAAGNGNVNSSLTAPLDDFNKNTSDTIKILDAIRTSNSSCKYLHISSAAVYGNPESLPVTEKTVTAPLSPYGWHKLMSEQLCKEYHQLYGIAIAITRPFSIYGTGLKKQLFWDIFQKYKENPSVIELWGSGEESRDFIYIDDVVSCMELILLKAPMKAEIYNIASGQETFIKDVVKLLFEHIPGDSKIVFNNKTRSGDPKNWKADISNVKALDFLPTISLQTGVHNVAEWLLQADK